MGRGPGERQHGQASPRFCLLPSIGRFQNEHPKPGHTTDTAGDSTLSLAQYGKAKEPGLSPWWAVGQGQVQGEAQGVLLEAAVWILCHEKSREKRQSSHSFLAHSLFCSAGLGLRPPHSHSQPGTGRSLRPSTPLVCTCPLPGQAWLCCLPPLLHDQGQASLDPHIPHTSMGVLCGQGFLTPGSSEPLPGSRGQRAWQDLSEPLKPKGRRPGRPFPGGWGWDVWTTFPDPFATWPPRVLSTQKQARCGRWRKDKGLRRVGFFQGRPRIRHHPALAWEMSPVGKGERK